MRLLVRGAHTGQFRAASHEFGMDLQPNQTMNVWFGPDDLDSLNEYVVPDHCPFATWVAMKHPAWLHEVWQQGPAVIVDDSEDTFLALARRNSEQ